MIKRKLPKEFMVLVIWLAIIIGSALAAIVQQWFITKKISVFTLPFIIVTWFLMYLFRNVYLLRPAVSLNTVMTLSQDFGYALRGFGQVIFQGSLFAGIVFFIGVFINSPIRALYGLTAAVVTGVLSAVLYSVPSDGIAMGLFSYNAVLCAIVFAGNRITDGVWTFIAVALSIVITFVMNIYELTPLTFPFVVATCFVLALRNRISKWLVK
jgi:urea transporter